MMRRVPSFNAFVTSSTFVPGSLWHISISTFTKDIFVDMNVLYATLISSALSMLVL